MEELIGPTGRALLQRDLNKKHYKISKTLTLAKAKDGVNHNSPSVLKID